jgi:glycerol kinase
MSEFVAAVDQGTTSTRCMIFDHGGRVVAADQTEHRQILPRAGWVEHDPDEILANTRQVCAGALGRAGLAARDLAALGITNQRETTVVWDRATGEPVHNAIVWQDTRTDAICAALASGAGGAGASGGAGGNDSDGGGEAGGGTDAGAGAGADRYRERTGLPLATYFAGPKIRWILDNVDGARARAARGELAFGTVDSWLAWHLTGEHVTDPTNASRTLLMDLDSLSWDAGLCEDLGVPAAMLPRIVPSSQVCAPVRGGGPLAGVLDGVPLAGILGDQQAATFGQACLAPGEAKNTYGTGNFVLLNTGATPVRSRHGLITTVCYQLGSAPAVYALEGSIAVTGSLVQWLRDNLGLISSAAEIEALASTVDDNGGAYIVPAFSGLFAPHWRADARGVITGLTRYVNRGHLARAALEATAFQTREVIDAMNADSGVALSALKVDGGMVVNELLMQFQADILGVPVIRPVVAETTALGAAYAAGLAVGFWSGEDDIRKNWALDKMWEPAMDPDRRDVQYAQWRKAVTKTFGWV